MERFYIFCAFHYFLDSLMLIYMHYANTSSASAFKNSVRYQYHTTTADFWLLLRMTQNHYDERKLR